eukprot:351302-Chlamydomonas_euryale.AAC.4
MPRCRCPQTAAELLLLLAKPRTAFRRGRQVCAACRLPARCPCLEDPCCVARVKRPTQGSNTAEGGLTASDVG